jgi:D-3-phosphoglycerate dehydrogenase
LTQNWYTSKVRPSVVLRAAFASPDFRCWKAIDMSAQGGFRVGLTHDFLNSDGKLALREIGLDVLDADARVHYEFLPNVGSEIPREVAEQYDALLVLAPRVTAATVHGCHRLALVARFGVGYDNVDVPACTSHDVLLTITPDGVRRPVAVSAIAMLLALSHRLLIKDRLTRAGRWHEKLEHLGIGLTGRTLGLIGCGNIGGEILRLAAPFEMRPLVYDPYASATDIMQRGAAKVELEELLRESDFIIVCCALTAETRHLLNAERLALMKGTAFVINVARGPIIDQAALTRVLRERRIGGAALDVFEKEPIEKDDPLLALDNVIVSPHAICWTDELFRGNGRAACQSIVDVAHGRVPKSVVNREVLERSGLQAKLRRWANV